MSTLDARLTQLVNNHQPQILVSSKTPLILLADELMNVSQILSKHCPFACRPLDRIDHVHYFSAYIVLMVILWILTAPFLLHVSVHLFPVFSTVPHCACNEPQTCTSWALILFELVLVILQMSGSLWTCQREVRRCGSGHSWLVKFSHKVNWTFKAAVTGS